MTFRVLYLKSNKIFQILNSVKLWRHHHQWVPRIAQLQIFNNLKQNLKPWNKNFVGNGTVDRKPLL